MLPNWQTFYWSLWCALLLLVPWTIHGTKKWSFIKRCDRISQRPEKINGEKNVLISFTNFFVKSFFVSSLLSFNKLNINYQRKRLKDIDFLVNALETVFFKCLNAVSVFVSEGQYYCKWICFLNVRIMSVIEVIVLFVELVTHTVLMILKKLNNSKQWCNLTFWALAQSDERNRTFWDF